MKIVPTRTAATCLAAASIALLGAPAAMAASSAPSAATVTQSIQQCDSSVGVLGVIEIDQTIASDGTANGTIYLKVPLLGKVKLATFSGNLYDGITISVNAVVASGSITLGVQSYNGVDWETVNAGLSTSFTGQISTNGPVRLVPICGSRSGS